MLSEEVFLARLQRGNRVQVPVLIRWKHRLDPGEVLKVRVRSEEVGGRSFYARLGRDGRFTVPKIVIEYLEVEPGEVLECTLYKSEQA